MHVTGEQLSQLTGVAAILRFPLPDIEDEDDDEPVEEDGLAQDQSSQQTAAGSGQSNGDYFDG